MKKSVQNLIYVRYSLLHFVKHKGKQTRHISILCLLHFFYFEFTHINYFFKRIKGKEKKIVISWKIKIEFVTFF